VRSEAKWVTIAALTPFIALLRLSSGR